MSCRARFSISRYCGPSHSAGKRGGEKLKSVGVNSEFVGVVGLCGRQTRIESFICVFFSVGGTGAAGDGDSTGLLCFLLFYNKGYGTAEWSECYGPVWKCSILYRRRNIKNVIET